MSMVLRLLSKPGVRPTYVGYFQTKAASNITTSSATGSFPVESAAGDYCLALVSWRRSSATTISNANGWELLDSNTIAGVRMSLFGKIRQPGENSMQFTSTNSASGTSVFIDVFAYRGVKTVAPINNKSVFSSTGGANTIVIPGMTVKPKCHIIGVGTYAASAGSRTTNWNGQPLTQISDNIAGTTGSYLGISVANAFTDDSGSIPDVTISLSASQGNRMGVLYAIEPA